MILIEVTDWHLEAGDIDDPERNPVALALWEQTGDRWRVEGDRAVRLDPLDELTVQLPWNAATLCDRLREGWTCGPFLFEFYPEVPAPGVA